MTPRERLRLTMKAEIFKAIGQPMRLAIMEILHENEMQAGRIAAQLGTDAPNVSRHLALLRKRGLVVDRKQGSNIFYRGTIPQLMQVHPVCRKGCSTETGCSDDVEHGPLRGALTAWPLTVRHGEARGLRAYGSTAYTQRLMLNYRGKEHGKRKRRYGAGETASPST